MTDYAYVAYLDILGYKELLDADVHAGTQTFKDRMTRAFRTFEDINTSRYHYKAISDSIFITCTDRAAAKEFLCVVRDIYISFLTEGLMIRGGVSFGQHFENPSITYSPVLTKAYLLESEIAEFPRIMVDSNLDDMFPELKNESLILRTGNHWFLNIVTNETFTAVWDAAECAFKSSKPAIQKSERIRIKHRWLQDFLIEVARKLDMPSPSPYLGIFDVEPTPLEKITDASVSTMDTRPDLTTIGLGRIKAAQQNILDQLKSGPADIVTIANTLGLHPMTVTINLRRFEQEGMVVRNENLWSLVDSNPK